MLRKRLALAAVVFFALVGLTSSQVSVPNSGISDNCGVSGFDNQNPNNCLPGVGNGDVVDSQGNATAAPTVTSVVPSSGPTTGGTIVIITGTQFIGLSGASAVVFGATNATSYTVLSSTSIRATAPAHVAGTIDVHVTNPIGTSPTNNPGDHFTFSTCTNSMDFTQACNSQYIGAL